MQVQKKKIWELVQPHLKTDASGIVVLGVHLMRTSAGVVVSRSLKNANISWLDWILCYWYSFFIPTYMFFWTNLEYCCSSELSHIYCCNFGLQILIVSFLFWTWYVGLPFILMPVIISKLVLFLLAWYWSANMSFL